VGDLDFAINGKEAIDQVVNKSCERCKKGYMLIFLDLNMPVMNGYQAAKKIRSYA